MKHRKISLSILALLLVAYCGFIPHATAQKHSTSTQKKNVLFICVDDLRPELGCYGASYVKTPNIDRLAQQGVVFENAYCQQAVCAPSRNSIMTGLRPDAMRIYDLGTFFRTTVPDVVTLPQQFKNNGYISETVGKIYHAGHGNKNDELSWTTAWNYRETINRLKKVTRGDTTGLESCLPKIKGAMLPYHRSDAPEEHMADGAVARIALQRIEALKDQDKPFFLAVGFRLPHLPFVAPAKYWDMYDPKDIQVPKGGAPEGTSRYAFVRWSGELAKYHGIEQYRDQGVLPDEVSHNLIHGYYASVSMMDAQVGKLLDALDKAGLRENTIVVLWGDHGWKLGEYGMWSKHSNDELDTRAPLIISAPNYPKGKKTQSLAELVDVYPTLCDLAGLEKPSHLQGKSLTPILKNKKTKIKEVAMSQYPRGKALKDDPTQKEIMGYSITDGKYRYTRWQSYQNPDKIIDRELYDHSTSRVSTKNLARLDTYKSVVDRMEKLLDESIKKGKAPVVFGAQTKDNTLKSMPYPWGAAIKLNKLKTDAKYREVAAREMSSLTTENAMKMGSLSRGKGKYLWDDADFFVDFAQKNNIRAHGHTLIWYKQSDTAMPKWVREFKGSKEEWKQLMRTYIRDVVGRYKGRISSWDVVNEAIRDDGTFRTAEECVWTKNIGAPEYIDWAFQCAHEADPNALLFYNDYGHEYSRKKGLAINALVMGMLERGVPIHGIGMQMHTGIHKDLEKDIKASISLAARTGLRIHISEINIRVNNAKDPNVTLTEERAKKQAFYFQEIAKHVQSLPEKQRHGITTWGLSDDDLWLNKDIEWPLLFDKDLKKKPAYYALKETAL